MVRVMTGGSLVQQSAHPACMQLPSAAPTRVAALGPFKQVNLSLPEPSGHIDGSRGQLPRQAHQQVKRVHAHEDGAVARVALQRHLQTDAQGGSCENQVGSSNATPVWERAGRLHACQPRQQARAHLDCLERPVLGARVSSAQRAKRCSQVSDQRLPWGWAVGVLAAIAMRQMPAHAVCTVCGAHNGAALHTVGRQAGRAHEHVRTEGEHYM